MAATTIVQARIDPAIRDRAADALANEGALTTGLTSDPAAHDAWFKGKLLEDSRHATAQADAEAHFVKRRAKIAL